MIDRSTSRTTAEVSDADLAEQSVPVTPDDVVPDEGQLAATVDRDALSADIADIVDQSIEVPLDDEEFAPDA